MPSKPRRKVKLGLSIDAELAAEAEARGENLAVLLEFALLRQRRWKKFAEENRAALEANAAQLERDGMWYVPDWLR